MSVLEVLTEPNKTLRTKSKPVATDQILAPKTQKLINDMIETMKEENGIGIAAPQVGKNLRIIIVDHKGQNAYINPKIFSTSEKKVNGEEGCLSVPGVYGIVERHKKVKVKALDREGNPVRLSLSGLPATVFQHEIDHIDGILFIDKVERLISTPESTPL